MHHARMKSLVCGLCWALGSFLAIGCNELEDATATGDGGTDAATSDTPAADTGGADANGPCTLSSPEDPPVSCPPAATAPKCSTTTPVSTCPTDTACMALTKQSGDVLSLRMGRIRLWSPSSLVALAPLAVDPNTNLKCANGGGAGFNWLMQIDKKAATLKTGGADRSADGKSWAFSTVKVDSSSLDATCPGFKGPTDPIDLSPVTKSITLSGSTFDSALIDRINIPIFEAPGAPPIILPIQGMQFKKVTLSADGTCVGSWDKDHWCDQDSGGWTTGGAVIGKITVEDADHVPLRAAGCQSLCAVLANDATKISGKVCKRGADGKIPAIGNATVTTTGDAFLLSTTFAAFGVTISP